MAKFHRNEIRKAFQTIERIVLMDILESIQVRAKAKKAKIVLPEGEEPRTLQALQIVLQKGLCNLALIGNPDRIHDLAAGLKIEIPSSVTIFNPKSSEKITDLASELYNLRKHKGLTYEAAKELVTDPLYFGALLIRRGECDGGVAGAIHSTSDVIRSAIQVVGLRPGIQTVSSCFLMVLPDGRPLTFADCAVVPYPSSEQLADIAIASAETHRRLVGEEPIVAMLSFSTKGSASHEAVDKVRQALDITREKLPGITIDGEFQFDTAFVESVGKSKAPDSGIAGKANVFIFPNLDAGNIGYKIAQRIGQARAIGPVLQGLLKPVNDLSRGCVPEDIVNVAAISALLT